MNLTKEQENVVDVVRQGHHNVLITGPGGTGKTELIKHIKNLKNELLKPHKTMGVTAMTGAAAVLVQGQTLHSYLGIGLARGDVDCVVKRVVSTGYTSVLKKLQILIVDEVSMLSAELFDKLEVVMRKVRRDEKPFGGVQLVLSGDFLQLPCIDGRFCFESNVWKVCIPNIYQFHLNTILRQDNKDFQDILNRARFGNLKTSDIDYITTHTLKTTKNVIKSTIIYCKNVDVDRINTTKLARLSSQQVYKYVTKIKWLQKTHQRCRDNTDMSKFKSTELFLSEGAQVILTTNLNVTDSLVNGSRGVVVGFNKNSKDKTVPVVQFRTNNPRLIDYHTQEITNNKPVATATYIPLKLAYAVTVHKNKRVLTSVL